MNSAERRLKLILLLQSSSHDRRTAQDLADYFGVSRRTIFRDLEKLQKSGVPYTWDEFRGYHIQRGSKLPPFMFTEREVATILVGLSFVESQVDQTMVDDAKSVGLKIKNTIPGELRDLMSSLDERLIVDPYQAFGSEKKDGGNWYLINEAIAKRKTLAFDYTNKGDQQSARRKVDPHFLVYFRDHWNVIAWCHDRSDFRMFTIDRIENLNMSDKIFAPHKDIDVEGLIFDSDESDQLIIVEVDMSRDRRFRSNLPAKIFRRSEQISVVRYEFHFDNLDFINEWLMQFGDGLTVIEPQSLISKRNELLRKMMQ
ncbi:MAG: helix-turn-helix transcriptional regulator [Bacteroidota bacterium]